MEHVLDEPFLVDQPCDHPPKPGVTERRSPRVEPEEVKRPRRRCNQLVALSVGNAVGDSRIECRARDIGTVVDWLQEKAEAADPELEVSA